MENRSVEELKNFCISYFNKKKTSSGINLFLNKNEQEILLEELNCKKIKECVHILIYGYIGICKICQKRTEYIDITKLYRPYCSHKCSTLDKESHRSSSIKSLKTKKENGIVPIIPKKIIKCRKCNLEISVGINTIDRHLGFCDLHKKKCIICDERHNKAGKCCSTKCTNIVKQNTNFKNSGVLHNLLRDGVRRNQIEFYLKKGLSYEESNKLLSEFQILSNNISNDVYNKIKTLFTKNNIDNISDYFDILLNKIINFNYREFHKPYELISLFCNNAIIEKYGYKYIYNKLYKMNNKIFNYKIIKFKSTKYGTHSYTKNGELLRSKLEYDFYRLLEINKIKNYKIGKRYPNSNYKYDFYLEDYDIYVEIAGMMNIIEYSEKMKMKKNKFRNLEILETYSDMLHFLQKIKAIR